MPCFVINSDKQMDKQANFDVILHLGHNYLKNNIFVNNFKKKKLVQPCSLHHMKVVFNCIGHLIIN